MCRKPWKERWDWGKGVEGRRRLKVRRGKSMPEEDKMVCGKGEGRVQGCGEGKVTDAWARSLRW